MTTAIKKLPQRFRLWWMKLFSEALSKEEIAIKRWYFALYIPLAMLLCSSSLFSDVLKVFIATPVFILIPYYWGEAINYWCFPLATEKLNPPLKIFIRWILGTLVLLSLMYFLDASRIYSFNVFYWGAVSIATIVSLFFNFKKPSLRVRKNQITLIILLIVLAIIPFIIIKLYNTFPLQRAGDNTFFARWAENIIQGELKVPLYEIGNYLPILPMLLALTSTVAHVLPLELIWGITILTYVSLSFGVYLLSNELTHNKILSIFVAALVVWYRNSDMVVDLINFRPKIMLLVIFVWSLYWFISLWRKLPVQERKINMPGLVIVPALVAYLMLTNTAYHFQYSLIIMAALVHAFFLRRQITQSFFLYLLLGLFWIMGHNFSGTVTLMLISLMLFYWRLISREYNIKDKIVSLLITFAGILFIATKMITGRGGVSSDGGILHFIRLLFIPDNQLLYDYTLFEKMGLLALTFSYAVPVLCVIGFIITLLKKRKDGGFSALLVVSMAMFVGYIMALPHIYRLADFMIFPVTFFGCFAVCEIWVFSKKFRLRKITTIIVTSVSVFYFIYFLAMPYVANSKNHWFTTFSIHEYEAAKWLRSAYGNETVVVTSPELAKVTAGIIGSTWQYDIGSYVVRNSEKVEGLYYYSLIINYRESPDKVSKIVINGVGKNTNVVGTQQTLFFMSMSNMNNDFINNLEITNASNIENVEIYSILNQKDKELLKTWESDELQKNIDNGRNVLKLNFANFNAAVFDKTTASYRTLSARPFLIYRFMTVVDDKEAELTMRIIKNYYTTDQRPATKNIKFFIMVSDATTDWIAKEGSTNESLLHRSGTFSRFPGFAKFFNKEYYDVVYSDKRGGVYIFSPKF